MEKSNSSASNNTGAPEIQLLDGRRLTVVPPKKVHHFIVQGSDPDWVKRGIEHHMFYYNAFNFFENSERILSDSCMFFTPIKYTSMCDLTLGMFIER